MTRPAAISQADIDRALTGCRKAGFVSARIRLDLANQTIDIFVGETRAADEQVRRNPWDDELADAPPQ